MKPLFCRGDSRLFQSDAAHLNSGGFVCKVSAFLRHNSGWRSSLGTHTHTRFFFPWCAYTVWPPARLSSDGRSSHRQLTAVTQRHVQHERGREHSSARTCYLFFNVVLHSIKNSASKSKDGVEFPPSLAK